ncbi:MAG: hypothetical protein KME06_19520 [Kastovskya adunca ATA6-11-RM4]|jgi:hypothetical protein|nr:hypothetical protein [Kastovskya adunca ATA6-11-RM4]
MSLERSIRKLAAVANALSSMEICTTSGCNQLVSKPGYKLCYECWKTNNLTSRSTATPKPQPKPKISSSPSIPSLLSATKISEKLALHNHIIHRNNVNRILAELGLLSKEKNGWVATQRGTSFGAVQKTHSETGNFYVVWSESILENKIFIQTLADYATSNNPEQNASQVIEEQGFRQKFRTQANLRTTDGHWVRSKAEVLIDNWLYMAELVHAYERRLPIEEEMYCDFYVPAGKVYIEYWGLENNPEYAERKKVKKALYQKYEFKLIELSDTEIKNLDDYLPKMLLNFGVVVS